MLHVSKRIKVFLEVILFFIVGLSSFSLYAKKEAIDLDQFYSRKIECDESNCYFPGKNLSDKDIHITSQVKWEGNKNLVVKTKRNIIFEEKGKIIVEGKSSVIFMSGMEPGEKDKYDNTVIFKGNFTQIDMLGEGQVKIYYNPTQNQKEHKYLNPEYNFYRNHIKAGNDNDRLKLYMLVNDIYELQSVGVFLSGDYALSQDIYATDTKNWNDKKGFEPLKDVNKKMSFSGDFDGNGYSIKNLFINRDENDVGLFGMCGGSDITHNKIENLILENVEVTGDHYVGSIAGFAANSDFFNIKVINPTIKSKNVAGGLIGTTDKVQAEHIQFIGNIKIIADEDKGFIVGGAGKSKFVLFFETKQKRNDVLGAYKLLGNHDDQTQICLTSNDSQIPICLIKSLDGSHDVGLLFNPSYHDITKILVFTHIESLMPEEVRTRVLEAEDGYNYCFRKNDKKEGIK